MPQYYTLRLITVDGTEQHSQIRTSAISFQKAINKNGI
jgi:hypothetical protein